ncbi:hypothetical protein ZYGR_0AN00990 [Zygosaccharomyces rouxii]|uniref:GATA-type domain-containing protein n=1 Tax=Zygosaccharomyces rouxii TaxID=4956 RepID=A0A1Q3AG36_ZYGRO|nr:hypothetical protein ZYGR_0AN00990 [Zygosaccharomyces rouxii]
MPEGASNFNLYDIIDQTPPTGLSEDIDKEVYGDNDRYTAPSTFAFNASTFDSMLEMLPDDVGINIPAFSGGESVADSDGKRHIAKDVHDEDNQGITNSNIAVGSLDDSSLQSHMDPMPSARPIDIASNQLSGEIAPLWDFKMEDFMMTPTPGDFNSSAPNSFNSNRHFHHSESAPTGQHGSFSGFGNTGFNLSQTLGIGMSHNNFGFDHSTSSSPRADTNHFSTNHTNGDDTATFNTPQRESSFGHRHSIGSRKPSNQFSKTVHTEDGGIALSSSTTMNSVRKNSLARQVSSTSLSNYKRGSNSGIPELPKKPPIQCYNCKTNKTPLWRRDAQGNTMCNACGLFQKLHGTMRPLSLKSDVIKKRNTKKRTEKEKQTQENGIQSNNNNNNNNNNSSSGGNNTKSSRQSTRRNTRGSLYGTSDNGIASRFPVLAQSITVPVTSFETGVAGSPIVSSLENRSQLPQASSQSQPQYERQQHVSTESLNPNNLMDHNKKMANSNTQYSRKSRRSSTSSNNSSSGKSFSRSVVPILPKPSPGASQFNHNNNGSSSAGNSAASSPRVFAAGCNPESPMNSWQQNAPSSSTGKTGISIPRPKSSRNYSSSSSFMAASLHQLQQQHQKQDQSLQQHQQSPNVRIGSGAFSMPNSWNSGSQTSIGYSPNSARSPKGGFDFVCSPVDSSGPATRNSSRKSHTSLLSQQLQNSALHNEEAARQQGQPEAHTPSGPQSNGGSNIATPQPVSLGRTSVTASPRNSYADSLLQQRGIKDESGSSFRRQNSGWPRKNVSLKEQVISSNAEATVYSNPAILAATPTVSTTASPAAAGETSTEAHRNITEELDWLKFKM